MTALSRQRRMADGAFADRIPPRPLSPRELAERACDAADAFQGMTDNVTDETYRRADDRQDETRSDFLAWLAGQGIDKPLVTRLLNTGVLW